MYYLRLNIILSIFYLIKIKYDYLLILYDIVNSNNICLLKDILI